MTQESLLLIPLDPRRPVTHQVIAERYQKVLASVLSQLSNPDRGAVLILAVAGEFLGRGDDAEQHQQISWSQIQTVLSSFYSVISFLCAKQSIPADTNAGPHSVDVRVVFVHTVPRGPGDQARGPGSTGTIIRDLDTFARIRSLWSSIFVLNSREGRELLDAYAHAAGGLIPKDRIISLDSSPPGKAEIPVHSTSSNVTMTAGFRIVCLGGTFDHLHPGHKLLLSAAAALLKVSGDLSSPSRFVIGITGDELLRNKKFLHTFIDCENQVDVQIYSKGHKSLLGHIGTGVLVECVEIQEPFGPTITIEDMDVLVVSGETRSGGQAVNDKRREKGWNEVIVYEVDVLDAQGIQEHGTTPTEDFAAKISSTAIRELKAKAAGGSGPYPHLINATSPLAMARIQPFRVEQWMDQYETTPDVLNVAETCASSVSLDELQDLSDNDLRMPLIDTSRPLTYGAIRGSEALRKSAEHKGIIVFSDEVYRPIFHDFSVSGTSVPPSVASLGYEKTIVTGSMSKAYALAGIRVGWVASKDASILQAILSARDYTAISVSQLDDQVAQYALSERVFSRLLQRNLALTRENLALLKVFVESYPSICSWVQPNSGTMAFIRFTSGGQSREPVDDVKFCLDVLSKTNVMLVPGSRCFGEDRDFMGYVRIGYACSTPILAEALQRLGSYLEQNIL
ncbi:unnamed protein product [Parascedosporium putredinis]|uniref:Uncharacterized protein n=1 Tax=Parascedosporium putredinis TaxID=1442378 RepID=A0A9P1H2R7_9PEZI|nr:unnamed protein product [Parascedosporium putredinis]CAI7994305.1 unnamed protein product [Parascedosporium putredinis]